MISHVQYMLLQTTLCLLSPALLLPPEPPLSPHPSNLMSSNENIRIIQGQRKGSLAVQTVSLLTKSVESRYKYSLPDLS